MSTLYVLEGIRPVEVTRWWDHGSYRWTLHSDTLDQLQIVQLFNLLDPVVADALLAFARSQRRPEGPTQIPAPPPPS